MNVLEGRRERGKKNPSNLIHFFILIFSHTHKHRINCSIYDSQYVIEENANLLYFFF